MIVLAFLVFEFFCLLFGYGTKNVVCDEGRICCKCRGSLFFKLKEIFRGG